MPQPQMVPGFPANVFVVPAASLAHPDMAYGPGMPPPVFPVAPPVFSGRAETHGGRRRSSQRSKERIAHESTGTGEEGTDQKAFQTSLNHLRVGYVTFVHKEFCTIEEVVVDVGRRRLVTHSRFHPVSDSPEPDQETKDDTETGEPPGHKVGGHPDEHTDVCYVVRHYDHWYAKVCLFDSQNLAQLFNDVALAEKGSSACPLPTTPSEEYPGAFLVRPKDVETLGIHTNRRRFQDVYLPRSAAATITTPTVTFPLPARHRGGVPFPVGALVVGTLTAAPYPRTGFRLERAAPCSPATLAFLAFVRHGTVHPPTSLRRLLYDTVNRHKLYILIRAFQDEMADLGFLLDRDAWEWPHRDPPENATAFVLELARALHRDDILIRFLATPHLSGARGTHAFHEQPGVHTPSHH